MDFSEFWVGILAGMLELIVAIAGFILTPVDWLVNIIVPTAGSAVNEFFTWINSMLTNATDFLDFFLYVLGISHSTWLLINACFVLLLLVFIFLFPFKIILSVMKGMR